VSEEILDEAISASRNGDGDAFWKAIELVAAVGWSEQRDAISERFAAVALVTLPAGSTLDHIASVAWRSYDYTRPYMSLSPYEIEFILRGYGGAKPLMEMFSLDVVLTASLALTGTWGRPDWGLERP